MSSKPRLAPSTFEEMRSRIVECYPDLSPQLRSIAQFALNEPEIVAMETIAQLSDRLNVPPSSIIRFSQAVGYSGFLEMKRRFSAHLVFLARGLDQLDISDTASLHPVRQVINQARFDIDALERDFDYAAFDRAAQLLNGARDIFVVAQHLGYPLSSLFAWSFIASGLHVVLLDNVGGFALPQSHLAGPKDVTVAISFSPYQPSVVQEALIHRENGGRVVSITDTPLSPLAPHSDELLVVPGMKPDNTVAMAGATAVVRALAAAVIAQRKGTDSALNLSMPKSERTRSNKGQRRGKSAKSKVES